MRSITHRLRTSRRRRPWWSDELPFEMAGCGEDRKQVMTSSEWLAKLPDQR
jgi:hypothetical protein